ncbi:MAG: hypothetical protein A2289_26605 [Deltaproteobacteria bacterium RIFOXYA12_FULL_58_15]|nr:MAG: hypothetical protein A2289_26605 [Deltaproteobacteria bacterium RIFOXYA12_FULL_58_15]
MPAVVAKKPRVWTWYVVYCGSMALLYLVVVALGIAFGAFGAASGEMDDDEALVMAGLFIALGGVFFVPYAIAPFLPKKSWTWIFGLVLIGLGLTSCVTLPFAIPLMIHWLKPETQVFLGRKAAMK